MEEEKIYTIKEIKDLYAQVFYMKPEHLGIIEVMCAIAISTKFKGDPVWLMIIGGSSSGKCLGKGTKIRMYNGTLKKVEDIIEGDLLMGDDSTPRKVLSLARGKEMMYKIHQTNGMSYVVNESHILSLKQSTSLVKKGLKKSEVLDISVNDFVNSSKKVQNIFKGYRVGVDYPTHDIEIDPYFLGLWLGDGRQDGISICNPDNEIIKYLGEYADKLDMKLSTYQYPNRCPEHAIVAKEKSKRQNPIASVLIENNLISNKHIPHIFKINSIENRLKLLAGIIDSDGYLSNKCQYEVISKRHTLAYDIKELAESLGLTVSINKTIKKIKSIGFVGEYYRILIKGDIGIIPVKIERKKYDGHKKLRDSSLSTLKIEQLKVDDYYGFEIDGNKRFLLEDYTVTHNTELINTLDHLEWNHPVSTMTENTFLSAMRTGYAAEETSLLLRIGNQGLITFKDYTTILSMRPDKREAIVSQMREIFDGSLVKESGVKTVKWPQSGGKGKINFILAVTPSIFSKEGESAGMGRRALYYVMPEQDERAMCLRQISNLDDIESKRDMLREAFAKFINQMANKEHELPEFEDEFKKELIDISIMVTLARTPVERNYKGDLVMIHDKEGAMRMFGQLYMLSRMIKLLNNGEFSDNSRRLIIKMALDGIPRQRVDLLKILAKYNRVKVSTAAASLNLPTDWAKLHVEDLNFLKICKRLKSGGADRYEIDEKYRDLILDCYEIDRVDADLISNDSDPFNPDTSIPDLSSLSSTTNVGGSTGWDSWFPEDDPDLDQEDRLEMLEVERLRNEEIKAEREREKKQLEELHQKQLQDKLLKEQTPPLMF